MSDSTVRVIFLGDSVGAERSVASLDSRMGKLGSTIGRTAKLAGSLAAAFAVYEGAKFLKDSVEGAAQLEVQQRRVNTIFGQSAPIITKFAANAAKGYGLSQLAAEKMEAAMGQTIKSMGLSTTQARGMSLGLTKLSADLASFTGSDPQAVFQALERGVLGATRGLKTYGINISQADIANQALASGLVKPIKNTADLQAAQAKMRTTSDDITKAIEKYGEKSAQAESATAAHAKAVDAFNKASDGTVPKLTTAQKSLASYQLIMKAGSVASGDFKKHSDDLGNEQKILGAEFSNIEDQLGKALLPTVTRVGAYLAQNLPGAIAATGRAFAAMKPTVLEIIADIGQVVGFVRAHWSLIAGLIKAGVAQIRAEVNLLGDLIHGRWNKIWDDVVAVLKATWGVILADLKLWRPVVIAIIKGLGDGVLAILRALPGAAGKLASAAGDAIAAGIKSAPGKLIGLAGDLGKMIGPALAQAGKDAYKWALGVGEQIAEGVLKGLAGLPGKIASAVLPGGSGKAAPTSAGAIPHAKAAGDKIDHPMLAMIGEDAPRWPEWVIPSNPQHRGRALGLLSQATTALGIAGFSAGGGPSKPAPHTTPHKLRTPGPVSIKSLTGAAAKAMTALTQAQGTVADLGRSYDQQDREYATTSDLIPFTLDVPDDPSDPTGSTHQVLNPLGINSRVGQLNQLVILKNGILSALQAELDKINDAIAKVQAAIEALLKKIAELNKKAEAQATIARTEHGAAAAASSSISKKGGLADQLAAERAKKKPDKAKITSLEAAIKQAGRDHDSHESQAKAAETAQGRLQRQAQTDAGKVKDLRSTLADLGSQQHDQPYDVRDQQIDVDSLNQEIRQDLGTTVSPFSPSTSSTASAIAAAVSGPDDSALIQQLTDALGLQGEQLGVLGAMPSFARGIAYVPNDMVAQLHKGETVRTAGETLSDMRNSTGGDGVTVHLHGVASIDDHVHAYVTQNGQQIAAAVVGPLGRSADRMRRSNRTRT